MEIFLSKVLGIYFIIIGVIIMVRRRSVIPTIKQLSGSRSLLLVLAVIELVAGLALVVALPVVSLSVSGILSLVGYMMVVESIIYLAAPSRFIQRFVGRFNRPIWYKTGGVLAVIAGIYLAGTGFGFF